MSSPSVELDAKQTHAQAPPTIYALPIDSDRLWSRRWRQLVEAAPDVFPPNKKSTLLEGLELVLRLFQSIEDDDGEEERRAQYDTARLAPISISCPDKENVLPPNDSTELTSPSKRRRRGEAEGQPLSSWLSPGRAFLGKICIPGDSRTDGADYFLEVLPEESASRTDFLAIHADDTDAQATRIRRVSDMKESSPYFDLANKMASKNTTPSEKPFEELFWSDLETFCRGRMCLVTGEIRGTVSQLKSSHEEGFWHETAEGESNTFHLRPVLKKSAVGCTRFCQKKEMEQWNPSHNSSFYEESLHFCKFNRKRYEDSKDSPASYDDFVDLRRRQKLCLAFRLYDAAIASRSLDFDDPFLMGCKGDVQEDSEEFAWSRILLRLVENVSAEELFPPGSEVMTNPLDEVHREQKSKRYEATRETTLLREMTQQLVLVFPWRAWLEIAQLDLKVLHVAWRDQSEAWREVEFCTAEEKKTYLKGVEGKEFCVESPEETCDNQKCSEVVSKAQALLSRLQIEHEEAFRKRSEGNPKPSALRRSMHRAWELRMGRLQTAIPGFLMQKQWKACERKNMLKRLAQEHEVPRLRQRIQAAVGDDPPALLEAQVQECLESEEFKSLHEERHAENIWAERQRFDSYRNSCLLEGQMMLSVERSRSMLIHEKWDEALRSLNDKVPLDVVKSLVVDVSALENNLSILEHETSFSEEELRTVENSDCGFCLDSLVVREPNPVVREEDDFCSAASESDWCSATEEKKGRLLRFPCAHWFHEECGRKWLKSNPACPTCRQRVEEAEK